jgi:hypothetical protein
MHAPINREAPRVRKYKKREKTTRTPFNKALLKPDPDFIDERKVEKKEESKGFFSKLLGI